MRPRRNSHFDGFPKIASIMCNIEGRAAEHDARGSSPDFEIVSASSHIHEAIGKYLFEKAYFGEFLRDTLVNPLHAIEDLELFCDRVRPSS